MVKAASPDRAGGQSRRGGILQRVSAAWLIAATLLSAHGCTSDSGTSPTETPTVQTWKGEAVIDGTAYDTWLFRSDDIVTGLPAAPSGEPDLLGTYREAGNRISATLSDGAFLVVTLRGVVSGGTMAVEWSTGSGESGSFTLTRQ